MKPVRVLIVDDSALMRKLLAELIANIPGVEVAGTAADAQDAREKIKQLEPDVLTLDVEMPGMNGLGFLEKIMSLRPMPVIMVSAFTARGADVTVRALEMGAVDYVRKPDGSRGKDGLVQMKADLAEKIRIAAMATPSVLRGVKSVALPEQGPQEMDPLALIAMGSSTGGVEALRQIFSTLPASCPPIVITQHMPKEFTASLAARLTSLSKIAVAEATDGAEIRPGHAYLAPGGERHLSVIKHNSGFRCRLQEGAPVSGHRPSVDVLFASVADAAGPHAVGVILSGMGGDGAQGLLEMRGHGAYTIGQDKDSCVVYGMPKVAASMGAVETLLPLPQIAGHILSRFGAQNARRYAT